MVHHHHLQLVECLELQPRLLKLLSSVCQLFDQSRCTALITGRIMMVTNRKMMIMENMLCLRKWPKPDILQWEFSTSSLFSLLSLPPWSCGLCSCPTSFQGTLCGPSWMPGLPWYYYCWVGEKERWANHGLPCVSLLSGKEEHLCQTFLPHLQCPKVKIQLWMSKTVDVWLWPGCMHPERGRHAASLFSPPPFQPRKQQNADLTTILTKIFTSFIVSKSLTSRSIFAASISSVATSLYGCLRGKFKSTSFKNYKIHLSRYPRWTDSFTIPLSRSLCLNIQNLFPD